LIVHAVHISHRSFATRFPFALFLIGIAEATHQLPREQYQQPKGKYFYFRNAKT
jgi:hypothetical protein